MSTHDDRGWVRPVTEDGDAAFMDPIEPTGRTLRSSVISGIVLVAVVIAAITATVIWRGRNGDPFASAGSVPADMDFVVTFDALALSDSERLQSFIDAFAVPLLDTGAIDDYPDDLVAAIDEAMQDEFGLTLSDDILPWIGRSVSIAGTVPELDMAMANVESFSFLVSADVRNHTAAEAFQDEVLDKLRESGIEVAASSIGGLPGYIWLEPESAQTIGIALAGDSLLVGIEDDVAAAIEASETGRSIADDAAFIDMMDRLPDDRLVSLYVASSALNALAELGTIGMPSEAAVSTDSLELDGIGTAVSLNDEGMLFSYVMVGGEETQGLFVPDEDVLASLPEETLGFLSIGGSANAAGGEFDEQMMADLGYSLENLSYGLGIDLVELIESLSGDITLAATESRAGLIAAESDVPVGVVGAIGLTDSGPVVELVSMLEEMFSQQGADLDRDGVVTTISGDGQEIISYAAGEDLLVIGTGGDLVAGIASGEEGGLLSSSLYRELDSAVVGDGLIFFADIARIAGLVPMTTDEAAVFAPLSGIGFGGEVSGDAFEMEVIVLVDY